MRQENKLKRQTEIEQAAYALLKEDGYGSVSMLKIAKRAKASNETLYRWYGDKTGLFRALVAKNATDARTLLHAAIDEKCEPNDALQKLGPVLLGILLGPQAVALNQAAASDPTGELGQAIAQSGRESVMPLIERLFSSRHSQNEPSALLASAPKEMANLYLTLLVGDLQIRRVIGQMPSPDADFIKARSKRALELFNTLCAVPTNT